MSQIYGIQALAWQQSQIFRKYCILSICIKNMRQTTKVCKPGVFPQNLHKVEVVLLFIANSGHVAELGYQLDSRSLLAIQTLLLGNIYL